MSAFYNTIKERITDDAWADAERETPCIEGLVEGYWTDLIEEEERAEELEANGQFGVGA